RRPARPACRWCRCRCRAPRSTTCSCTTPAISCATRCRAPRCTTPTSCTTGSEAGAMHRIWAIIETDLRRFRPSPRLMVVSMVMPLVQLVVRGHAFGGRVTNLEVGVVDQDHGVPALKLKEMFQAVAANARTFEPIAYSDEASALRDLHDGRISGVV